MSYDTQIKEGDIYVYDMFNLYKYENMLYTMKLSGKEVRDALEMSYDLWTNRMTSPDDHILLLRDQPREALRTGLPSRTSVSISIPPRASSTR